MLAALDGELGGAAGDVCPLETFGTDERESGPGGRHVADHQSRPTAKAADPSPAVPAGRALPEVGSMGDRVANIAVTVVPFLLLAFAVHEAWGGALHWQDLLVFAIVYVPIGFGVTVGYHRLFTHRSFQTSGALRALWAILGSAAVEGPVIEWVAYH